MTEDERIDDEARANRIRSIYKTVDNYRKTSMATHNALMPSVRLYAAARRTEVQELADRYPEGPLVQRWAQKFDEMLEMYDILD